MSKYTVSMSNSSIWLQNRTFSGAIPPGQNGPRSDANGGVLHIPQKLQHYWNFKIRLFSGINTLWGAVLPHSRDAVGVFSNPSRRGQRFCDKNRSPNTGSKTKHNFDYQEQKNLLHSEVCCICDAYRGKYFDLAWELKTCGKWKWHWLQS